MNYETDIKPLEDAGQTDEQIVATLQQDTRHKKNIMATGAANINGSADDLHHILVAKYSVLWVDEEATWKGPLVDYMKLPDTNEELRKGFWKLLSNLQVTNRPVFCATHAPTGYLVTAIAQIVDQLSQAGGQVVSDINAITGGPIWANLTVEQIQEERQLYLDRQNDPRERWQVGVQAGALVNEAGGTVIESFQAAINAAGLTCDNLREDE